MFKQKNKSKLSGQFVPSLERLESRETPVVGAFSPVGVTTNPLYDGVVRIIAHDGALTFLGTGTLLIGRTHILTAAHVVTSSNSGNKLSGSVDFVFGSGGVQSIPYTADDVTVFPGYSPPGSRSNAIVQNDVALIRLTSPAPGSVTAFDMYRNTDEIGKTFTMVGFGNTGTGAAGATPATYGVKRMGTNTFEATGNGFNPTYFRTLGYDFDDGTTPYNSITNIYGLPSNLGETSGATLIETAVNHGDSGGPGFIEVNGTPFIAGIAGSITDTNNFPNGSFGSGGFYARVSDYARAIDLIVGMPNTFQSTTSFAISQSASSASVSSPEVKIYDSTILYPNNAGPNANNALVKILAFDPGFTGGVTVAMGDVNQDGFEDLIVGAGAGGGPHIKVFSGADYKTVLYSFFAFEPTFTGGVTLASGDTNNDGYWDIIVGAG
ncbi:MAG: trypsin-like serine protease, partial [Gemmataceae bacterium]